MREAVFYDIQGDFLGIYQVGRDVRFNEWSFGQIDDDFLFLGYL